MISKAEYKPKSYRWGWVCGSTTLTKAAILSDVDRFAPQWITHTKYFVDDAIQGRLVIWFQRQADAVAFGKDWASCDGTMTKDIKGVSSASMEPFVPIDTTESKTVELTYQDMLLIRAAMKVGFRALTTEYKAQQKAWDSKLVTTRLSGTHGGHKLYHMAEQVKSKMNGGLCDIRVA